MKNDYSNIITSGLARKLITTQFPEFAGLPIRPVKIQGHDNRSYRLGDDMLIRMPTAESYALKVPTEQKLLPKLASHLSVSIPVPLKMGSASKDYPFCFSIYEWLDGESANSVDIKGSDLEHIARDLVKFLSELQNIDPLFGPLPGQHNWWRGEHISIYDTQSRSQIKTLASIIDSDKALKLWEDALKTKWERKPVWIHGDFAIFSFYANKMITTGEGGAIIFNNQKLLLNSNELAKLYCSNENVLLDELLCATGITQIKQLQQNIKRRQEIFAIYDTYFKEVNNLYPPVLNSTHRPSYYQYFLDVENLQIDISQLINRLKAHGIEAYLDFEPNHKKTYYKNKFMLQKKSFPISQQISKKRIILPCYPLMSLEQAKYVAKTLVKIYTYKIYV